MPLETNSENPAANLVALSTSVSTDVRFEVPEVTSLCPVTGQPDFAVFRVWFKPAGKLVELKSLKLYFWAFRNLGVYHEAFVERVYNELAALLAPEYLLVEGDFLVRGGIHTVAHKHHNADALLAARQSHFAYRPHG